MGRLKTAVAPVAQLHANPWNPNRMNERQYAAEKESITAFGFIDPVTVRPHPELAGEYQVIDGEHRVRAATDLGITDLPVVVLDVNEAAAKKLTIVLNETRGRADTVDLAAVLADLQAELGAEVLVGLPYTPAELEELLSLSAFDWDAAVNAEPPEREAGEDGWHRVAARLPEDAMVVLERARAHITTRLRDDGRQLHSDAAVAWGQVLEALAAEYLAAAD